MIHQKIDPYLKGGLGTQSFFERRRTYSELHESEQKYLNKNYIHSGSSILDIGCACGNLGNIIVNEVESDVNYTGIDVDEKAIELGKKHNGGSGLTLISGSFPEETPKSEYDYICAFNLFEQLPDWKQFLLCLSQYSNKYINIGLAFRLTGSTVIDIDVSYGYYFDSGERVHKIVHNIYELLNFCCINEMRVKKINFHGYSIEKKQKSAGDFRAVPINEEIRGNLLLELFPREQVVNRYGATGDEEFTENVNVSVINNIRPECNIIIDGALFEF